MASMSAGRVLVDRGSTLTPRLRLEKVTKTWKGRATPVLDAVDLELGAGTVTRLEGDNGAGKTTLLRIVCGLLVPDQGRVLVDRFDLSRESRECRRRIGFLAAGSSGLYARLTARQQLDFCASLAFVAGRERARVVDQAIERFALGAFATRRLDRISMGERQRVRLAMTFLHRPELVLLDEPRTSLDAAGLRLLTDAIDELRARDGSVIWCAPSGEPFPASADEHLVVRAGSIGRA
jgi:ABC-type multidrug transport system ATPase subunit